jgi:two-component system, sensor histidine kinase SagS
MSGATYSQSTRDAILDCLPEGVAVVDQDLKITWVNRQVATWFGSDTLVGVLFYEALNQPDLMGSEVCPLQTAFATDRPSTCTISSHDHFFHLFASPSPKQLNTEQDPGQRFLVVTLSDVTAEILQQQKLAAIHQAGSQLTDLKPDEIFNMDVEQRIELLKDNIRHYTQDLLNIEVIEIRLLEHSTGNLIPLLSVGLDQSAADRRLQASPQGNGVTGYVAASGKSYLCRDTACDVLYLHSFQGARSSLTVPIMLHDQLIGTINVESPKVSAFDKSDQQFLEIFARDVAVALNTLELLVAQSNNAAQQSCEAIHAAVAMPIDDILLNAVHIMEKYIGHDVAVTGRLQRILKRAREVKQAIHRIGESLSPAEATPPGCNAIQFQKFKGSRILVVDADEQVRNDAHTLLERYGCIVETAQAGEEAVLMVRNCAEDEPYDVIISDIRLPDFSGYQLMVRLQNYLNPVPMVLMTGFGYDPGHSIVKARQAGLHPKAILFKPFRLDQLVSVIETILDVYKTTAA